MKKKLKTHFAYLEKENEKPKSFQLTLLHPFLSYLQVTLDDNDNSCSFGFADTQMAITTAFLFDTIPYMKTVERMTNPCFLNTGFASVMKGKHVTNTWEETLLESVGEVSSEKENVTLIAILDDQAMAEKELLKWPYVDAERIAVWGWSGGGTATLNLMFQYPEIYKTGSAIAAVANQLTYDNIYQERYMGLPQENRNDFTKGSPITYAKNLQGNLLYIHGTGDDNVHYANAEMLINELVKHNKQFQLMVYPNRTHSISEGEGTYEHLSKLYSEYLRKNCPPGGR
jgi:dienelactone hydrolase